MSRSEKAGVLCLATASSWLLALEATHLTLRTLWLGMHSFI